MTDAIDPDPALLGMPSLSAIKAFLAAAKYRSFTDAASALCVTQAAVSKQVRELEAFLGTELFVRAGRAMHLSADGELFRDAAQLSFINIQQATQRLRKRDPVRQTLTVCCSPAFSSLCLQPRLPAFMETYAQAEVTVLATQNFLSMEAGVQPDVVIAKMPLPYAGYESTRLFDDRVYPVCTPRYLEQSPPLHRLDDLRQAALLDLSAYGRAQISEHVDWSVWLAIQSPDLDWQATDLHRRYRSNDYPAVLQMALDHQGVALGWHHLVGGLVDKGTLVRPLPHETILSHRSHFLAVRKDRSQDPVCAAFCDWITGELCNF